MFHLFYCQEQFLLSISYLCIFPTEHQINYISTMPDNLRKHHPVLICLRGGNSSYLCKAASKTPSQYKSFPASTVGST